MKRALSALSVVFLVTSFIGAAPALAQDATAPPAGITTIGYGHASAPAATAELQLLIQFDTIYGGAPAAGAGGMSPVAEATPGAQILVLLDPLVQHVRTLEGVERAEVVVPIIVTPYKDPTILGRLDVTVAAPTSERLVSLYREASRVAFENRMLVGYMGAAFTASDCAALEREARQAALDDARERASLQAELLDAELGEVVASADVQPSTAPQAMYEYGIIGQAPGACDPATRPSGSTGQPYPGITLPPFDPNAHTGQVDVYRQIRVTWAIAPAGG